MEVRINLVLLVVLTLSWGSLSVGNPVAAFDPEAAEVQELAFLEDALASDPRNEMLAAHVMGRYIDLGRPGFAIATGRSTPGLADDPWVAHRLAQAYEASDRPLDALAMAKLARSRCGQTLVDGRSWREGQGGCRASAYNAFAVHERALHRMVEWGVASTSRDARAQTAYALALRRATVAIHE